MGLPGTLSRRDLLRCAAAATVAGFLPVTRGSAQEGILNRPIPSSGERIPAVGLGSWITFNVGNDPAARDNCTKVMRAFFDGGGRMIDSSPMYGSAQSVIGEGLRRLGMPSAVFSTDKVWTGRGGARQVEETRRLWGVDRLDLLQVHNLRAWDDHLPMLFSMKAEGRLRYVGITTSEGRRRRDIEAIMAGRPIDFVQITYNPLDREVEERILPLARDRGIAVIVNRPFRQGNLTEALERTPLPGWAAEIGCRSWAQTILKFIIAHPAVTCAIPATTRVDHVVENLNAAGGPLPDDALRRRIAADIAAA